MLQDDGAQRWPLTFTSSERNMLKTFLIQKCSNVDGFAYRSNRNAYPFNHREMPREVYEKIFTRELELFLTQYFGSSPVIYTTEIISVEAMSCQQEFHRDHGSGPRLAVCLAFTVDGSKIGTLYVPKSHIINQENDKVTKNTKIESAWWKNDGLLYDIFTLHAGCENKSKVDKNLRVFITFLSSSLSTDRETESKLKKGIYFSTTFQESKWNWIDEKF